MSKEEIFYKLNGIYGYELTHQTFKGERNIIRNVYKIRWLGKTNLIIDSDITEEEYNFLKKELENE